MDMFLTGAEIVMDEDLDYDDDLDDLPSVTVETPTAIPPTTFRSNCYNSIEDESMRSDDDDDSEMEIEYDEDMEGVFVDSDPTLNDEIVLLIHRINKIQIADDTPIQKSVDNCFRSRDCIKAKCVLL